MENLQPIVAGGIGVQQSGKTGTCALIFILDGFSLIKAKAFLEGKRRGIKKEQTLDPNPVHLDRNNHIKATDGGNPYSYDDRKEGIGETPHKEKKKG